MTQTKTIAGYERNADGDHISADGVVLSRVNGGRYVAHFPAGWVDDIGDRIRTYEIPGLERAAAFADTVRGWQQ